MIERTAVCIEPVAQHLFQTLEAPLRSRRVLDRRFWRHAVDDTFVAPWWPAYLDDVRRAVQTRHCSRNSMSNVGFINDLSCSSFNNKPETAAFIRNELSRTVNTPKARQLPQRGMAEGVRSFTKSFRPLQQQTAIVGTQEESPLASGSGATSIRQRRPPARPSQGFLSGNSPISAYDTTTISASATPNQTETTQASSPVDHDSRYLREIFSAGRLQEADEAWSIFVKLKGQETFASQMLDFLSASRRQTDLSRAARVYEMIPQDEKDPLVYEHAVKVALARKSHPLAVEIHKEAVSRSLNKRSSKILLAYLVQKNLWQTAAKVWEDIVATKPAAIVNGRSGTRSENDPLRHSTVTFYDRIWQYLHETISLPDQLLALCRRLLSADLVLRPNMERIRRLAHALLLRVVFSPRIMTSITGKGLLALFEQFHQLGLLRAEHYFQAIRTLHLMIDTRNRAQLAMMVYRNLRFRLPGAFVPKWVYGSMLSICTSGGTAVPGLRFLLDEFATIYGCPDKNAYQKVLVACAHAGDVQNTYDVFQCFVRDHGRTADLGHLTPLLYVHARTGDVKSAEEQFDRLLPEFHVRPNTYCWNLLLTAYARARDAPGAFLTFHKMQSCGSDPDTYTFGTLMGLCANNGDIQAVNHLVDLARERHVPGTYAMIDSIVHTYCLNDDVESAEALVETATDLNLQGSPTRMWNTLLRHYAFSADSEAVLRIQKRMRDYSVKPDEMTYAALMSALVVIGKTQDAAQILRALHFSADLTANLFHYSIILHGYAQEGNRDMVSVIYHEMLERFPRISASAKLAMLHSQHRRDMTKWRSRRVRTSKFVPLGLPQTLDFLTKVLPQTGNADLASKDPQPGFGRRSTREALPSIYMEFLIEALNTGGAYSMAEKLLARCQSLIHNSPLGESVKVERSIQLLTACMSGCARQKQFAEVDDLWDQILSQAISPRQQHDHMTEFRDRAESKSPPKPSSSIEFPAGESLSPIAFSDGDESSLDAKRSRALPAQRFLLDVPLTRYMHALSGQGRFYKVPSLVRQLENAGFVLTTRNWNAYVQVLAQSSDPNHQLMAFEIFEEKLLGNASPWALLKRGKWIPGNWMSQLSSSEAEQAEHHQPVKRRLVEKFRPGLLVPSYLTTVYLGSALLKIQQRNQRDDSVNISVLRSHAPKTVSFILEMPYLRDRAQGVLLRGREVKGDPVKRPRRPPVPDRSGIRGSKSPLDHIPINYMYDVQRKFPPQGRMEAPKTTRSQDLRDAEKYTGEILRSRAILERRGRDEDVLEYVQRLGQEQNKKLAVIEQMRRDALETSPTTSNSLIGEPHIDAVGALPQKSSNTVAGAGSLATAQVPKSALDVVSATVQPQSNVKGETDGTSATKPIPSMPSSGNPPLRQLLALSHATISAVSKPHNITRLIDFQPPRKQTSRQRKAFLRNRETRSRRRIKVQQDLALRKRRVKSSGAGDSRRSEASIWKSTSS